MLAASSLGCAAADAPRGGAAVRDSAGIRILEHPGEFRPSRVLDVDLRIAPDPARPETLFGDIADLAVDREGRLYVLDRLAGRVVVFDRDGDFVRRIGRPGDGPGELGRFAASLLVQGDTVAVAEWGRALLHRFDPDGAVLAATRFPLAPGSRSWWRTSSNGGFLLRVLSRYTDEANRWRGNDALLHAPAGADGVDTVLRFEYSETDLGGPGDPSVPMIVNAPIWAELADGRIAWTDLESTEVRIVDDRGRVRAFLRQEGWARRPPDDADRGVLLERFREKIAGLGGDGSGVEALPIVWPSTYPAITGLAAGPDTTLWVQRMGPVDALHPGALNSPDPPVGFGGPLWDVFDGELRRLETVEVPRGLRLFVVTRDALYGVATDALDQETILRLAR